MTNSLVSFFDTFNNKNSFVGFDHFFNEMNAFDDMMTESFKDNFPLYNIYTKQVEVQGEGEDKMTLPHTFIEIACAGFNKDELNVYIDDTKNTLVLEAQKKDVDKDKKYTYKGIATRMFKRVWKLSDDIKFTKLNYTDGILTVEFEPVIKEEKSKKRILTIE